MLKLINVVAACSENRVIGREGRLPWRIPEDAEHFRKLTTGAICILGRVCFDTWPDATREGRQPIVLTSRPLPPSEAPPTMSRVEARAGGQSVPIPARSMAEALAKAETLPGDIFICGGQRIFEEALELRRPLRLHLTLVHAEVPGDRYFPEWRHLTWRELDHRESRDAHFFYSFITLERVDSGGGAAGV